MTRKRRNTRRAFELLEPRALLQGAGLPAVYWNPGGPGAAWMQNNNWIDAGGNNLVPGPFNVATFANTPPVLKLPPTGNTTVVVNSNGGVVGGIDIAEPVGTTVGLKMVDKSLTAGWIKVSSGSAGIYSGVAAGGVNNIIARQGVLVDDAGAGQQPSLNLLHGAPGVDLTAGQVAVGYRGQGNVVVQTDCILQATSLAIGAWPRSDGSVSLELDGAMTVGQDATVGCQGTGLLTMQGSVGQGVPPPLLFKCSTLGIGTSTGGDGTVQISAAAATVKALHAGAGEGSVADLLVSDPIGDQDQLVVDGPSDFGKGPGSRTGVEVQNGEASAALVTNGPTTVGSGPSSETTVVINNAGWWVGPAGQSVAKLSTLSIGGGGTAPGGGPPATARVYLAGPAPALHANSVDVGPGGYLEGAGTVDAGTVTDNGSILPGNTCRQATWKLSDGSVDQPAIGRITVSGSLAMGNQGVLGIDIAADGYSDVLAVEGNVTVGGTLALYDFGGFEPAAGDYFVVLRYCGTRLNGADGNPSRFAGLNATGAPLPAGDYWHLDYDSPGEVIAEVLGPRGKAISATEGAALSDANNIVATISGVGSQGDADAFDALIDWGYKVDDVEVTSTGTVTYDPATQQAVVHGDNTFPEQGTYAVTTDIGYAGEPFDIVDSTATVADAALQNLAVLSNLTATEGQALSGQMATFTDLDTACQSDDYTATIDWNYPNDSTACIASAAAYGGAGVVGASHTYAAAGVYTVLVTVNDVGGSSVQATGTITVDDAPLLPPHSGYSRPIYAQPGSNFSGAVANFFDTDGSTGPGSYTATITWPGNSQSSGTVVRVAPGLYSVTGSHTFAQSDDGAVVTTTVTDSDGGATATLYGYVTFHQPGDAVTMLPLNVVAGEGQALSDASVAAFTDPSPAVSVGNFAAEITWPDNSQSAGTVCSTGDTNVFAVTGSSGSFKFTDGAAGPIITAISERGSVVGSWLESAQLTEAPVSPTIEQGLTATEGLPFADKLVATFTDPGASADHCSAIITWAPGHSLPGWVSYNSTTGQFDVSGGYTYAEEGSYPISVEVDDGGTLGTASGTITVADAALTAGSSLTVTPAEGQEFTGVLATFTDADAAGVSADYAATINWGDGSAPSTGFIQPDGESLLEVPGFTVTGTHTYAEAGSYNISVAITDNDGDPNATGGATATGTLTATVTDAPLAAEGTVIQADQGSAFSGAVASFWDDNPDALAGDFTAAINWGDGVGGIADTTAGTVVPDGQGGFLVNGTHTYLIAGDYPISVTVTDGNGQNAPTATAASEAFVSGAGLTLTGPNATLTGIPSGADITVPSGVTLDLGNTTATLGTVALTGGTIQNGTVMADAYNLQSGTVSANLGVIALGARRARRRTWRGIIHPARGEGHVVRSAA
jgi:hypothetical protein